MQDLLRWPGDRYLGRVVDGRYAVWGVIASGHRARVYEAVERATGKAVALKVLIGAHHRDGWLREITHLSRVEGPRVVSLLDYGELENDALFIVTERVDSITLSCLLRERGPLDLHKAAALTDQLLEALEHVHGRGLLHRDLSGDAVMVSTEGGAFSLTLTNFASACSIEDAANNGAGCPQPQARESTQSAAYMAPEQFVRKPLSVATDLYSVAALMVEMVTGCALFASQCTQEDYAEMASAHLCSPPEPSLANSGMSPALMGVLAKALNKRADARYAHAGEMRAALWGAVLGLNLDVPEDSTNVEGSTAVMPKGLTADPVPLARPHLHKPMPASVLVTRSPTPKPTPAPTAQPWDPLSVTATVEPLSAGPRATERGPSTAELRPAPITVSISEPPSSLLRSVLIATIALALIATAGLGLWKGLLEPAETHIGEIPQTAQIDPQREADALHEARLGAARAEAAAVEETRKALEACRCAEAREHLEGIQSGVRNVLLAQWRQCVTPAPGEVCKPLR